MKRATPLVFSNPRAKIVCFDKDNGKASSFKPDDVPENHFHLGGHNYAVVSDFADVARIHLHSYKLDATGSLRPTKDGITVTPSVWLALVREFAQFIKPLKMEKTYEVYYGKCDSRCKPVPKKREKLSKLDGSNGQSASSQMWVLMRILPLLIGDKVPYNNDFWNLYLLRLTIIDTLMAPVISLPETYALAENIADHHKLFLIFSPNTHLTPRMLFALHYPRIIRQLGLPVRVNRLLVQTYIENYDCRPSTKDKLDLAKDIVSTFPVLKGSDGEGYEKWFGPNVRGAQATGFIADRFKNFRFRNLSVVENEELGIGRINTKEKAQERISGH
ncbi:PC4 domain-containing protein [Trichonephila inaurata madagascariensis]|uniref:PC4 domain-containing protein n=1 Tax=Trichonephila inaurata madagascariensis TaxID=2747483 RepID=A0A8X7CLQ2_9ARAC|nr:PC4 domain-containing protein [Trichonephila inaurata madagascariensis]